MGDVRAAGETRDGAGVSFTEAIYRAQEQLKDLHQEALEALLQRLTDAGKAPSHLVYPAHSFSPFSERDQRVVALVIVTDDAGAELGRVWVEWPDVLAMEPSYEVKVRSACAPTVVA